MHRSLRKNITFSHLCSLSQILDTPAVTVQLCLLQCLFKFPHRMFDVDWTVFHYAKEHNTYTTKKLIPESHYVILLNG
jgi:hypothetical protein